MLPLIGSVRGDNATVLVDASNRVAGRFPGP